MATGGRLCSAGELVRMAPTQDCSLDRLPAWASDACSAPGGVAAGRTARIPGESVAECAGSSTKRVRVCCADGPDAGAPQRTDSGGTSSLLTAVMIGLAVAGGGWLSLRALNRWAANKAAQRLEDYDASPGTRGTGTRAAKGYSRRVRNSMMEVEMQMACDPVEEDAASRDGANTAAARASTDNGRGSCAGTVHRLPATVGQDHAAPRRRCKAEEGSLLQLCSGLRMSLMTWTWTSDRRCVHLRAPRTRSVVVGKLEGL